MKLLALLLVLLLTLTLGCIGGEAEPNTDALDADTGVESGDGSGNGEDSDLSEPSAEECEKIESLSTYTVREIVETKVTNDGEVANFVVCEDEDNKIILTMDMEKFDGNFPGKELGDVTAEELQQLIESDPSGIGYGSMPAFMGL